MGRPGLWEILIIAIVVMLLFGAKKLPEFARYLGKALKEFKKTGKEIQDDFNETVEDKGDDSKA